MAKPDEAVVRRVLATNGRGSLIRTAVAESWSATMKQYPQRAWWRRRSTHAGVMWEHSVQNAISMLDGDRGCKVVPHDDTYSFIFEQAVLVRFKKADIELMSRNYPTSLATLFHNHEAQLPGFEDLHRVEAAYVLNQYQTNIEWIGIVARQEKRVLWHFDLETQTPTVQLPLPERTETAAQKVLRPKGLPDVGRADESE